MMTWQHPTVCIVSALLFGLAGCEQVSTTPTSATAVADHYEESHGIPAHRPVSFANAVEQLTKRRDALLATLPSVPTVEITSALQELKDIVRWLPELAGDSELGRADWERVSQLSDELEQLTESWKSPDQIALPTNYDKLLAELRPLAERSVTATLGQ